MKRWLAVGWMAALLLGGCEGTMDTAPYIWPTPFFGDPPKTIFSIRYSKRLNAEDQVRELIAKECGPKFDTARIFEKPYSGTAMHPQMALVVCGNVPPPDTDLKFVKPDPGQLITLRDPAPDPLVPAAR